MTTCLDMIESAARKIGVLGDGEDATPTFAAKAKSALNSMLDSWQIERLMVYQIVQGSHTWPAATTSRTIGSGGDFAAQRPVRIESCFVVDSNSQWYPVGVLDTREEYDGIVIKTTPSTLPQYIFMDPAYPLGVLYLWCVPSVQLTLKLNTWQTLQSFASLTTDLSLPPGYQRAIEFNLAIELHADYPSIPLSATVVKIATDSKAAIKALNSPSMVARVDDAVASLGQLGSRGRYNIYSDTVTRG